MPTKKASSSPAKKPARKVQQDAIALLKGDHKKVRALLETLDKTDAPARRVKLLSQIDTEVKVHATIEEEIFYPAFKRAAEESEELEMFFEAKEEHGLVELMLPKAKASRPESEEFGARAKVLMDLILHHAKEEEKEMFKAAKSLFSKEELQSLGEQMERRKRELMKQMRAAQ
jgi:hemerythrin superfamily protein